MPSEGQWFRRAGAQASRNHCAVVTLMRTETIARPRPLLTIARALALPDQWAADLQSAARDVRISCGGRPNYLDPESRSQRSQTPSRVRS